MSGFQLHPDTYTNTHRVHYTVPGPGGRPVPTWCEIRVTPYDHEVLGADAARIKAGARIQEIRHVETAVARASIITIDAL
jgi:hypothetical protein